MLRSPYTSNCLPIGSARMRLPVAAKIALISAGATGGTPGLADAARRRIRTGRHDVDIGHARRLVDPDHREVVEIVLLYLAVFERDLAILATLMPMITAPSSCAWNRSGLT